MKEKIKSVISLLKDNWKTPRPGEYTTLKEFIAYCFGAMGVCGSTFIAHETVTFAAGYFCGSIMGISLMDFTIITIIALCVKYVTIFIEPYSMAIFDHKGKLPKLVAKKAVIAYSSVALVGACLYFVPSEPFEVIIKGFPQIIANIMVVSGVGGLVNWFVRSKLCTKMGRYRPFLLIYGIPVAVITSIIPFIPPTMEYTSKLVLLHFAFTLRGRFTTPYTDAPQQMVSLITPNLVERQRYYSIGGIFLGFLRSILRIIFPLMIISTGGYLSLKSYQIFIPVLSIIGILLGFCIAGVKERVIERDEDKPKVSVKRSMKNVLSNKYFWILNTSNFFAGWNNLANNMINFFFIYSMRIEWIVGLISIFGVTSVLGNLMTPILVKRYEKRTLILVLRSLWIVLTALQVAAIWLSSPALFLIILTLRSPVSAAANGITMGLNADILDFHQCKTGERADSMASVFGWVTSPVTTLVGLVAPFLLGKVGYTSDWDVMFDSDIFQKIVIINIVLSVIGLVLSTIPYAFYDLTKEKHDNCVEELKARLNQSSGAANEGQNFTEELVAAANVDVDLSASAMPEVGSEVHDEEN